MMREELYNKLVERINDEVADVNTYGKLAEEETGYCSVVLRKIMKDEESHARYLMDVIERYGKSVPDNVLDAYKEAKAKFR